MPITSSARHALLYKPSVDQSEKLADIESLLETIRSTRVSKRFKKMMLDRVVWLVVESTGNFFGRYRSEGVITSIGKRIQRDHIFTREALVAKLLDDEVDVKKIIEQAQCCIVTHDEHQALSRASRDFLGWERYSNSKPPVIVYDMLTKRRMN